MKLRRSLSRIPALVRRWAPRGPSAHPDHPAFLEDCLDDPVVHVEITSLCNFHCFYCISPDSPRVKQFMDYDLFAHILPQLRGLTAEPVRLHIDGEPTLHPRFADMVALANGAGHRVALATNGSTLDPDRMLGHQMNLRIHVSHSPANLARRSKLPYATYLRKLTGYLKAWHASESDQYLDLNLYYERGELPREPDAAARYQTEFAAGFLRDAGLLGADQALPPLPFAAHNKAGRSVHLQASAVASGRGGRSAGTTTS